jgi:rRNA maturation endonuclease Nob1
MDKLDFDNEKKWCDKCNAYQRYLMSVNHSFCAECGGKVRLFSKADAEVFSEDLLKRRWRGTGS